MQIIVQTYAINATLQELMTIKCALDLLIEERDGDNEAESMLAEINPLLGF